MKVPNGLLTTLTVIIGAALSSFGDIAQAESPAPAAPAKSTIIYASSTGAKLDSDVRTGGGSISTNIGTITSGQPWRISDNVPSKSNSTCVMPGRGVKLAANSTSPAKAGFFGGVGFAMIGAGAV